MLRENEVVGGIAIYREEVRPFSDKQIELVQNFAAQAVIAIQNTRLLNELRQSLEQQTATSEVLRVISSSANDLRPVFETIAHNSVHLCGATYGVVFRFDGEMISFVAHHNLDQAAIDAVHHDEPDVAVLFRQQFRRDLRAGRFTMEFAQSGDTALQRITDAAGLSLILILSDINMPGMTGLELLPKAKAVRPDVPVIMITAYGDVETRRKALEGGAEALFTKPD
jgi:CheY-like chemotaxis protein